MLGFNSAAVACKRAQDWQGALQVLRDMDAAEVAPDVVLLNTAMGACRKAWRHSLGIWHQLRERSLQPSAVSFSTVMAACTSNGHPDKALEIFDSMAELDMQPNVVCFSVATTACERRKDWRLTLALLRRMEEERQRMDLVHMNSVISTMEKCGQWAWALWILKAMPKSVTPDVISYNAAISAQGTSRWQHAWLLLEEMRLARLQLDVISFSAAITAMARSWRRGCWLLAQMRSEGLAPNGPALVGAGGLGHWQRSLEVLQELRSFPPSLPGFGALCRAWAAGNHWQQVLALLEELPNKRLEANIIIYNNLLKSLEGGSRWEASLALLEDLPRRSMQADAVSYWSTMDVFLGAGCWNQTLQLLQEMTRLSLAAHVTTVDEVYDHNEQAGSIVDCFKHCVLVLLLQRFLVDERPFTYVDTHAGRGIYDLHSAEAGEWGNFIRGINVLERTSSSAPLAIAQFLARIRHFNRESARFYLGSPMLARAFLRPHDSAWFLEASGSVFRALKQSVSPAPDSIHTVHANSYTWLQDAALDGRVLVLIDPPYEPYNEYLTLNLAAVQRLHQALPESCVAMWYPLSDPEQRQSLRLRLEALELPMLIAELFPATLARGRGALLGSGLAILNPPETAEVKKVLKYLQETFAADMEIACFRL
ncbi:unnamed protein product [Effrenium voratum]|uniref:Pentatricopeptide repeat-containing protein n=2 Tax=Effrenium voratum TaxID=2562239 RepID=A0AA36NIP0_9DINO|nr:unnamed protein product [Effrenium voratum]CAJ1452403.1 unnamed protein product [Effrenium voratum]